MGSRWYFFMVVAMAGLAFSVRPGPSSLATTEAEQGDQWERVVLFEEISECPYGESPGDLETCKEKLSTIEAGIDVVKIEEGDSADVPSGCGIVQGEISGIVHKQGFFNSFESEEDDSKYRMACYFNLKRQAVVVRGMVNNRRIRFNKDKLCASLMLSTSASKVLTEETDVETSPYQRAVNEGYETLTGAENEVREFIGKGEGTSFRRVFASWLRKNRDVIAAVLKNGIYRDVGVAVKNDGNSYGFVLKFGAPVEGIDDERLCK